jgi:leucyl-tRNA synthetase
MSSKYDHKQIEAKWRENWEKRKLYKTPESKDKEKFYVLDMFPYPSGSGLHVGHPRGFIATDVFARTQMLKGYNVLHPMGWDAFGLPAENYAIKNKVHPRRAAEENIATFKGQLQKLGFTYDWDREINTTDPQFYKWTQWIFLQLYKKGLAYQSYEPINWCPSCQTGLANEDLENGKCERCGSDVEQKPMRQWVLKITDYADRLLDDLDKLDQWSSSIVEMQRNWIGRSNGAKIKFQVKGSKLQEKLEVFTTRPDTLFGCTYMVIAPEHELVKSEKLEVENFEEVKEYIDKAKKKTELQRTAEEKEKTGVKLEGVTAVNPVNGKELPVFVADYVLAGYGTGAIMAVPAHDERDFEFAATQNSKLKTQNNKEELEIIPVVKPKEHEGIQATSYKLQNKEEVFTGEGVNINSDFLNGLETSEAKKKIIEWLEENDCGEAATDYKLKDWVFSRQRYWGEPIPLVHCPKCGVVPVPEEELPVELPDVSHYEPSGTGESPLTNIEDWVNTKCPQCGAPAKRETNTMPQWAGSSWYYLRYIDPDNNEQLVNKEKEKYWSPVDLYVGGAEHATRHLIYARFWHKFLYDIGVVNYDEPFTRLEHVGIILAEDGRKMSKRFGNVINPNKIVEQYGADTMRVYEMFMGPFNQSIAWSTNGLVGVRRFLERIYNYTEHIFSLDEDRLNKWMNNEVKTDSGMVSLVHKTIKKVNEDIYNFKFNTAISQLMIFRNKLDAKGGEEKILAKENLERFLIILSPFAPHLAEELWEKLGHAESIFQESWPEYDPELIKEEKMNIAIQVNGKLRDAMEVESDIGEEEVKEAARQRQKVRKWLDGKEVAKAVYVEGRLVNFVVK